ncbi:MAG TPA: prepilin-type N-terminal cleavage/methylation domain-containing protein [Rhizomicrobium sp.]|jgi:general secretion pathway protein I
MTRRDEGFTLVEVLVALAIVVVSMGLLFKLIGMDLDRSREASRQTEAVALIQSLFTKSAATPQPGVTTGMAQDGLSWMLAITPYGGERKDWRVDAVSIAATVSWQHDGHIESRSLTTLRLVPKGVPQ